MLLYAASSNLGYHLLCSSVKADIDDPWLAQDSEVFTVSTEIKNSSYLQGLQRRENVRQEVIKLINYADFFSV